MKRKILFPSATVTVLSLIFSMPVFFILLLWHFGRVEKPSYSAALFGIILFCICAGYIIYTALTSRIFIDDDQITVYSFSQPQSVKYEQIIFIENEIMTSHRGFTPVIVIYTRNRERFNILSKGYSTEDLAEFLRLIKLKNKQVEFSEEIEALSHLNTSKQTALLFKTIKYSWFGILALLIIVNIAKEFVK